MASLRDFLFGAGTLDKVARSGSDGQAAAPAGPAQPSGIDLAAEAQKAAARAKTAAAPPTVAPSPAPVIKKKPAPAGTAAKMGSQFLNQ